MRSCTGVTDMSLNISL